MNTPNLDPRPPEPLTPEERALAARLAQLGPHGTPPPALDATIIAAARAVVGDGQGRPHHGRWPALLGLAATLALAIGVTWQMQPGGDVVPHDDAPRERASAVATEAAVDSAAPAAATAGMQAPLLADDVAQNGQKAVLRSPPAETDQMPVAGPGRAKAAASAVPAPPPFPQPQSAPPAAPPAPLVAEQAIDAPAPAQAQHDSPTRRMPQSRAESNASASASAPMEPAMVDAGAEAVAGGDLAGVPVARDGDLVPMEWIERIRLRRDAGDSAGALESLKLLRRAYPQTVLPDDLQNLAETPLDQP